jgi:hypothetical protein
VKRILLVLAVSALMVAMVLVMAGTALARGSGEARVPSQGATQAAGGLGTAGDAYASQPHGRHFP